MKVYIQSDCVNNKSTLINVVKGYRFNSFEYVEYFTNSLFTVIKINIKIIGVSFARSQLAIGFQNYSPLFILFVIKCDLIERVIINNNAFGNVSEYIFHFL